MMTEMKPNQTCYDRAGRRLTFIAMVGDKALVQSWHLEESVWHEHGHTMEEMAAVEGPIWLEDPAKLYDKPPVVVVNQEMVKAQEALIAAMADLAQKKRDVDAGIREAKARLAAEQRQCEAGIRALATRGVDVAGFLNGEFKFFIRGKESSSSFDEPEISRFGSYRKPVLKMWPDGSCGFLISTSFADEPVSVFRTEAEAKERVREIIGSALARSYHQFQYGRDRLEAAAVKWGVPIPEKWAAEKAKVEQALRERERADLEAKLQKLSAGAE